MNKLAAFGLAAVAVVVVLVTGPQLLDAPATGGVGHDPLGGATRHGGTHGRVIRGRTIGRARWRASELSVGPLLLWDGAPDGVSISVTIPGDGWYGEPGQGWFSRANDPNPPGTGMIVYGSVEEYYVYGDPCHWQSTKPETPAATVDEMVVALQDQAPGNEGEAFGVNSTASKPTDTSLDGYNGRSITLHAPVIFAHICDREQMAIFASEDRSPDRYLQRDLPDGGSMQGQFDELWILDVNGQIVVLDLAYRSDTPQDALDELRAILASATLEVP